MLGASRSPSSAPVIDVTSELDPTSQSWTHYLKYSEIVPLPISNGELITLTYTDLKTMKMASLPNSIERLENLTPLDLSNAEIT